MENKEVELKLKLVKQLGKNSRLEQENIFLKSILGLIYNDILSDMVSTDCYAEAKFELIKSSIELVTERENQQEVTND